MYFTTPFARISKWVIFILIGVIFWVTNSFWLSLIGGVVLYFVILWIISLTSDDKEADKKSQNGEAKTVVSNEIEVFTPPAPKKQAETKKETANFCHICGAELIEGSEFCHKCGTRRFKGD